MIPYLNTPFGSIPTFTLCIVIGVLAMLLAVHVSLRKALHRQDEEIYIFPKLVISGFAALLFAGLLDSVFKFLEYGEFKIGGITFYGGLIGAILATYIQLKILPKNTQYSVEEWFDKLTLPMISFHFFGRIGCFLGGCCYGKNTDSVFGVVFPDIPESGIIHAGIKCFPTQLFEAAALVLIFLAVAFAKKKFKTYLLLYALARFFLEFFRGDDRGLAITKYLSPSQTISVIILIVLAADCFVRLRPKNKKTT